jgi:hypothetical protein
MALTLYNAAHLLQLGGVSWVVWAAVLIVLLAGVSMLIYYFTRFKRGEKDSEEDWSLSQRSIFVDAPPASVEVRGRQPEPQKTLDRAEAAAEEASEAVEAREAAGPEVSYETAEPPPVPEPVMVQHEPEPPPPVEQPATQLLSSDRIEAPLAQAGEAVHFDEDVWAELEEANHEPAERPETRKVEEAIPDQRGTSMLGSVASEIEPPQSARIDRPAPRAPFDSPRIEPVLHRKPFEPPSIEPLLPGERLAKPRATGPLSRPTTILAGHGEREREAKLEPERVSVPETIEQRNPFGGRAHTDEPPAAPPEHVEAAAISGQTARASGRKRAGTILNLPPEASSKPLILGEPRRAKEDLGIGSLTNYGQDTGPRAGHGGTIALIITVLLVAGSTLAYIYVPSVNSRVNDFVARVRNRGQQPPPEQPAVEKPRARILPSLKPEVNKNMVKIRGAVYNTSDQPLEGLSVEITLRREGEDSPTETRAVAVNPSTLAPGQQGIYELEYDGKSFKGAGVTNLTDKDGQVKYTIPLQK